VTRSTPAAPLARRRTALGAALLASAALGAGLLSGCSAGQITGTDTQVAAVPGVSASSADGKIALREGVIAYASAYKTGATVPLELRLFNNSGQVVRLTGVTSDRGQIVLVGGASTPTSAPSPTSASSTSATPNGGASATRRPVGSTSVNTSTGASATVSATVAASPATPSPTPAGSARFDVPIPVDGYALLTVEAKTYLAVAQLQGEPLRAGESLKNVTLTFTYADGSSTTISDLEVPMTLPLSPLPKPSVGGAEH
jgi:hypothetical protein